LEVTVANTASKPLPSKYVIARPESYAAFDLSAPPPRAPAVEVSSLDASESAQKTTAERQISAPPKTEKISDTWSEAEKNAPKVKDADKDRFESPDDMAAGPTTEKFAASSEAIDKTPREKRAVWVVHGMGQQIPFETLDSLATGILDALPNPTQIKPRLRTVKIADQVLQRVELDIDGEKKDDAGKPLNQYELHLYETYWAPKTEGVANLTDVVSLQREEFQARDVRRYGHILYSMVYAAVAASGAADFGGPDSNQRRDLGRWRSPNGACSTGFFKDALAAAYRAGELHGGGGL
jgi:hypothetical protein